MGPKLPVISLLLPTRQRPGALMDLAQSVLDTAEKPTLVEIVTYIDDDDYTYDNLQLPIKWVVVRGPRDLEGGVNLSIMWNKCWEKANGQIFMHCGDDIRFRTEGWDRLVRQKFEEYPDRIAFLYGDDGSGDSSRNDFGTHGFIHKNWTDVIGRFCPPYFVSDYNDTWFNDVSKDLGRHFHIDVLTEHMHFSFGKSKRDLNTDERLARHEKSKPQEIYYSREKRIERKDEVERLRVFIDEYK